MRTAEKLIIDAGDLGADLVSELVNVYYLLGFSIHFFWTGTPVGELVIQATNRSPRDSEISDSDFDDLPETTISVSGEDSFLLNVDAVYYRNMRVKYNRTSGSGQLFAEFIGKGR